MIKKTLIAIAFIFSAFGGYSRTNQPVDANFTSSTAARNSNAYNYNKVTSDKDIIEDSNFSDDFNLPVLRPNWETKENKNNWSLKERPGFLRINSQTETTKKNFNAKNSFSKKVSFNTNGEVVSYIDLSNLKEGDETGLFYSNKKIHFIEIAYINGEFHLQATINNQTFDGPIIAEKEIMLKTVINTTKVYFEYSIDGLNFIQLGTSFKINTIHENDDLVGIHCLNKNNNGGLIDIDWFYFKKEQIKDIKFAQVVL